MEVKRIDRELLILNNRVLKWELSSVANRDDREYFDHFLPKC
jgi:hypothetical protein